MPNSLTISGAYGRDYKSKATAIADWEAGLDFFIRSPFMGGAYVNKQDAQEMRLDSVCIRYQRDTKVVIVKVEAR
jgi:hypothetical protein